MSIQVCLFKGTEKLEYRNIHFNKLITTTRKHQVYRRGHVIDQWQERTRNGLVDKVV